ncbi:MAG: hypothetical protein L6Q65_13475 [Zoogloea sp.]|nr:hypothetical protein [Zoogloea sp.]
MQAQTYDYNLTAGGAQVLAVAGSSLKLLTATGLLEVQTDTGARMKLLPGQGLKGFKFERLTLIDRSGVSNKGTILVSDSEMIDDRVNGIVTIADQVQTNCSAITMAVAVNTVAFSYSTIVAPGVSFNPYGILVRYSRLRSKSGPAGWHKMSLVASPIAPTSFALGIQGYLFDEIYSENGAVVESKLNQMRTVVPAGWGLYVIYQGAVDTEIGEFSISYEKL